MRRRPLIIVLVLAGGLLLAAALSSAGDDGPQATRPPDRPRTGPPPRTITARIPAAPEGRPVVRAAVGDTVELTVAARAAGTVALGGYDRVEPVDPLTPARFTFTADRPGSFPIRVTPSGAATGRTVAVVRVAARRAAAAPGSTAGS